MNILAELKRIKQHIAYLYSQISGASSYTPAYKVYTALLTQTSTNAPGAIVLENTLGFPVNWVYYDTGYYYTTVVNNFPSGKVAVFIGETQGLVQWAVEGLNSDIALYTFANTAPTAPADGQLNKTAVEIRIYP